MHAETSRDGMYGWLNFTLKCLKPRIYRYRLNQIQQNVNDTINTVTP